MLLSTGCREPTSNPCRTSILPLPLFACSKKERLRQEEHNQGVQMVRFKNRYLLIELVWADNKHDPSLSSYILVQALKELIRAEFGEYGLACALQALQGKIICCIELITPLIVYAIFIVKYLNNVTNLCILRVAREYHKLIWTCVTMMKQLQNRNLTMRVIHSGGTRIHVALPKFKLNF